MRKLVAVRMYQRSLRVSDVSTELAGKALREAGIDRETADAIYKMTSLCTIDERYVLPPIQREEAMEAAVGDMELCKGSCGLGYTTPPKRGG